MKVFISADIEGVTGVVSWHQCGRPDSQHPDFAFARRMMTHDVNAAIRGARAARATEIVVKDSHCNSKNLLVDELEPGVELISGYGVGTDGMMQGIDETFDAAMLIGYHAMAGTPAAVMEHTITGGVHRITINDQPVGEIALSAGVAGIKGVPVAFVSSDVAGCAEAIALLPQVGTVSVKTGFGRYMARLRHPSDTGREIESGVRDALLRVKNVAPWRPEEPTRLRIEFNRAEEAEACSKLLFASRTDAYTIEATFARFEEAHRAAWNCFAMSGVGARSGE